MQQGKKLGMEMNLAMHQTNLATNLQSSIEHFNRICVYAKHQTIKLKSLHN
jgi:hypothetical protein